MQRNDYLQRGLALLSMGIVVVTLFSGCQFFSPDIKDNTEPPLANAQDDGDFGGEKPTRK